MTPTEPNKPELKLAIMPLTKNIFQRKDGTFCWTDRKDPTTGLCCDVLESEWLYVMHLVEQTMDGAEYDEYEELLRDFNLRGDGDGWTVCSTFNQRATAMCKVKNIEV